MIHLTKKQTQQQRILSLLRRDKLVHFRYLAKIGHRFGGRLFELANKGIFISFVRSGTANLYFLVNPIGDIVFVNCRAKPDRR